MPLKEDQRNFLQQTLIGTASAILVLVILWIFFFTIPSLLHINPAVMVIVLTLGSLAICLLSQLLGTINRLQPFISIVKEAVKHNLSKRGKRFKES